MNAFAQFALKSFASSGATTTKAIAKLTPPNLMKPYGPWRQPGRIIAPNDSRSAEKFPVGSDIVQNWKVNEIKIKRLEEVLQVDYLEDRKMFRAFAQLLERI